MSTFCIGFAKMNNKGCCLQPTEYCWLSLLESLIICVCVYLCNVCSRSLFEIFVLSFQKTSETGRGTVDHCDPSQARPWDR